MSQIAKTFTLSACALAASLLISACGGGTGVIDTVVPTVDIVGSLGATPGTVEFKFTFSEDVGQSFVVEDVVISGDTTAATLTRSDAIRYTLVVTPKAAGTFKATVPVGKFQDTANNASIAEFSSLPFTYTTTGDTTKPTVGIASVVNTNGTVTLTYTFSEEITGFTKDDVIVSSGTKADVVKSASDPKVYTQVITPGTIDQTLTVSMLAGAFTDLATIPNASDAVAPKTINLDSSVSLMSFEGTTVTPYPWGLGTGYAKTELEPEVTNSTNKVLTVQKAGSTAEAGGGVVLSTVAGVENTAAAQIIAPAVTLTGLNKTVTMRVKAPGVAAKVLLKFEDAADSTKFIQLERTTTTSTDWQILTFEFPVLSDVTYNKMTLFPGFGETAARTFYIDDIKLIPSPSTALVTMDESNVTAGAFGKATADLKTEIVNGLPNKVVEVINPVGAEDWAGIVLGFKTVTIGTVITPIITTGIDESALKATNLKWTMRVFSPAKDIAVRIKLEDVRTLDGIVYNPNNVNLHRVEVDVKTTVANAWEVLTFDFSKVNSGTPAFRPDYAYNKVVVFFNADQKKTATQTFRCDDLRVLN
jgi:hypothetical protein